MTAATDAGGLSDAEVGTRVTEGKTMAEPRRSWRSGSE
jgi:hypothetical protein